MPPKQKSITGKLKQERRQLRRSFTKIYNDTSSLFDKQTLSKEELAQLKSSFTALNNQFNGCKDLEKQLKELIIEEVDNQGELDTFFDEVNEVTSQQHSKVTKLEFILSKYDTYPTTPSSSCQEPSTST